jgi:hypothetical protein
VIGGGVGLVATGGVLYRSVADDYQRLKDSCGVTSTCAPSRYRSYQTRSRVGIALAAGGIAALGVGLAWLLWPQPAERPAQRAPRISLVPDAAGFALTGTF